MTAPLPPLPEKAVCGTTERWFGQAQVEAYAKLAVREALERAEDFCDDFRDKNIIRAMIEEYKND